MEACPFFTLTRAREGKRMVGSDVQLLVRCNGNLAVIDCRRRLTAQGDPVVADNVDAHEWVLLIDPAAVPP